MLVTLKVLFKLRCEFKRIHSESTKLRNRFKSRVSRESEDSASFIAAIVVLLGRSDTKAKHFLQDCSDCDYGVSLQPAILQEDPHLGEKKSVCV